MLLCGVSCGGQLPDNSDIPTDIPADTTTGGNNDTTRDPILSDTTPIETTTEEIPVITENTLILAQNKASDYVIITPSDPTSANTTAAQELQSYLQKISGATLPIYTDAHPESEYEIVVGYTNRAQSDSAKLGNDGFVIRTQGKKLFIEGSGVRGAIYGVYAFLEEYQGCRFYTSEYEKIPTHTTTVVQPIEKNEQIPVFLYRDIDFVTSRKNNFQAKIRANGVYGIADKTWGGRIEYVGGFVHTLNNIVSTEKYFDTHPEYWALKEDGTRQTGWGSQLCLSNPDVLQIVKDHVAKCLADRPDAHIISISQNDSTNWQLPCLCEDCKKIYEEEGAYSGALIRFVNTVAAEFAEKYPNVKFDTLAYKYSRSVCKTKPADNVIVRLCTIECCFSHPLGSCPDVLASSYTTKPIAEEIADWGKLTDNIYVWDYVTDFSYPVTIFPNFNTLLHNVRFFAENSVVGLYEEGNYFSETGDFSDLRCYIMGKLLWNPYMTEQEYWAHIDDFLQGVYGDGWRYIREYIDLAQELVKDKHFSIITPPQTELYAPEIQKDFGRPLPQELTADMMKNYTQTDWSVYYEYYSKVVDNALVQKGTELFDKALAAANQDQQQRIIKVRLQLDFLRSYALYEKMQQAIRNMEKLVDSFVFDKRAGSLTMDQKREIIRGVDDVVRQQLTEKYEEYNRQLCLTALKYGDFMVKEGGQRINSENYTQLNFKITPDKWWGQ